MQEQLNEDTINQVFDDHYQICLQTAKRILRRKEDAEDAVQSAYCAAFRSILTFRGQASFRTWITRIVVNCCLMQIRKRRKHPSVGLDEIPMLRSPAVTPEVLCCLTELRASHRQAMSRLPQTLHEVYEQCSISGLTVPEVAHELGLSVELAKSRLFRARRKVEHILRTELRAA